MSQQVSPATVIIVLIIVAIIVVGLYFTVIQMREDQLEHERQRQRAAMPGPSAEGEELEEQGQVQEEVPTEDVFRAEDETASSASPAQE
jgi:hypothetical protein